MLSTDREENIPEGLRSDSFEGLGPHGRVWRDHNTLARDPEPNPYHTHTERVVVKAPDRDYDQPAIDHKASVYERLLAHPAHPAILRYHGRHPCPAGRIRSPTSGIRIEYAPRGPLPFYFALHPHEATTQTRLRWATEIASGLAHLHSLNIIHGDLTWMNILLTAGLEIRVAGFANSIMDGAYGATQRSDITPSHMYPGSLMTVEADLFALGSVLFCIWKENMPFHECMIDIGTRTDNDRVIMEWDEITIKNKIANGEFPDTESLGRIGAIISRCWNGGFETAKDVQDEIEKIRETEVILE